MSSDYSDYIQILCPSFSQLYNKKNIKWYSKINVTNQRQPHKSAPASRGEDLRLRWDSDWSFGSNTFSRRAENSLNRSHTRGNVPLRSSFLHLRTGIKWNSFSAFMGESPSKLYASRAVWRGPFPTPNRVSPCQVDFEIFRSVLNHLTAFYFSFFLLQLTSIFDNGPLHLHIQQ